MKTLDVNEIAERLNELKQKNKLSNSELADYGGTTFQTIGQLLKANVAKPNIVILQRIAEHLNVDTNWLLYGVENKTKSLEKDESTVWELYKQSQERIQELKENVENLKYTVTLQKQMLSGMVNFHNDIELPPYQYKDGILIIKFGQKANKQKNQEIQEVA